MTSPSSATRESPPPASPGASDPDRTVAAECAGTAGAVPPAGFALPGYEIECVLGRGGMGVVYKARQVGLNRYVALKMILAGNHASPEEVSRFLAEAEAVARLQHSNIVQIYQVGRHGELPFFALEYADGGTLAQHLAGVPQPPHDAARTVECLARAMHLAHQKGIVHRDLKPSNVLLASGGRKPPVEAGTGASHPPLAELTPKISDFGLAK